MFAFVVSLAGKFFNGTGSVLQFAVVRLTSDSDPISGLEMSLSAPATAHSELHLGKLSRPQFLDIRRLRPACACTLLLRPKSLSTLSSGRSKSTGKSRLEASSVDEAPAGEADSTREQHVRVKLRKPMGMVLAEGSGTVFVEEVISGGNADKSSKIEVGDVISRCSAYVLKSGKEGDYEREGYGKRPYTNWEQIMFDCSGQDFKTVMSAISSNNERWGIFDVTLELRRTRAN